MTREHEQQDAVDSDRTGRDDDLALLVAALGGGPGAAARSDVLGQAARMPPREGSRAPGLPRRAADGPA